MLVSLERIHREYDNFCRKNGTNSKVSSILPPFWGSEGARAELVHQVLLSQRRGVGTLATASLQLSIRQSAIAIEKKSIEKNQKTYLPSLHKGSKSLNPLLEHCFILPINKSTVDTTFKNKESECNRENDFTVDKVKNNSKSVI